MSNNHIIQYILLTLIILFIIYLLFKWIIKMQKCDNSEDICRCCPTKSICNKAKKSRKDIAQSKK